MLASSLNVSKLYFERLFVECLIPKPFSSQLVVHQDFGMHPDAISLLVKIRIWKWLQTLGFKWDTNSGLLGYSPVWKWCWQLYMALNPNASILDANRCTFCARMRCQGLRQNIDFCSENVPYYLSLEGSACIKVTGVCRASSFEALRATDQAAVFNKSGARMCLTGIVFSSK